MDGWLENGKIDEIMRWQIDRQTDTLHYKLHGVIIIIIFFYREERNIFIS